MINLFCIRPKGFNVGNDAIFQGTRHFLYKAFEILLLNDNHLFSPLLIFVWLVAFDRLINQRGILTSLVDWLPAKKTL